MNDPQVTIVVSPRERFSTTRLSLESIYSCTEFPFRLVYIDGGSPGYVKRYLKTEAQEKGFTLIRTEHYLSVNESRNLAMRDVRSKYVVFVENDVVVTPGWLDSLVQCAEETDAWLVCPLYCEGDLEPLKIHHAWGEANIHEKSGKRYYHFESPLSRMHLDEVRSELYRRPTGYVESHCYLMRREAYERIGPLDEAFLTYNDYVDICFTVREAGGSVYFEPGSVVLYYLPLHIKWSDLPFFILRWSDAWNNATFLHNAEKWNICLNDPTLTRAREDLTAWRLKYSGLASPILRYFFGWRITTWMVRPIDHLVSTAITRWAERKRSGQRKISRIN